MPEIHPTRIRINGKYWTLTTAKIPGYDGLSENSGTAPNKHIWINKNLRGKPLLGTILHEVLHCVEPRWSEDAVLELEKDLTDILWKLGYRSEELGDEE